MMALRLLYEIQGANNFLPPRTWTSSGLVIEQNDANTLRVRDNVPMDTSPTTRFLDLLIIK